MRRPFLVGRSRLPSTGGQSKGASVPYRAAPSCPAPGRKNREQYCTGIKTIKHWPMGSGASDERSAKNPRGAVVVARERGRRLFATGGCAEGLIMTRMWTKIKGKTCPYYCTEARWRGRSEEVEQKKASRRRRAARKARGRVVKGVAVSGSGGVGGVGGGGVFFFGFWRKIGDGGRGRGRDEDEVEEEDDRKTRTNGREIMGRRHGRCRLDLAWPWHVQRAAGMHVWMPVP